MVGGETTLEIQVLHRHGTGIREIARETGSSRNTVRGVTRQPVVVASPEFDQIGALLSAANQALTRATNAVPVATKPGDAKALVDASML